MYLILLLLLFIKLIKTQELFTSSIELNQLLNIEKEIPKIIENYIKLENERLENLKKLSIKYQKSDEFIYLNSKDILNPLNALNIIKKLTKIWEKIKKEIQSDLAENYLKNISKETYFPTEEDLNESIKGLLLLQDVYKLKTKDLANGILLDNININKQMNVKDCYEIAIYAYNEKDYYHSLLWIQEAYERNKYEKISKINNSDILNILSISLYKQGNLKKALEINNKLINIDPLYPNAVNNSKLIEQELKNNGISQEDFNKNIPSIINNFRNFNNNKTEDYIEVYNKYCNNEKEIVCLININKLKIKNLKEISKFYCYYKMDHSFLRLAPIKVEIIHFKPLIVIFRNIISDKENELMKNLSIPKLVWGQTQTPKTGEIKLVKYRNTKNAWLNGRHHPFIKQLAKRLMLMTNLNMKTAESLQMGNYGINGHVELHYDFAKSNAEHTKLIRGNRIATILFYLTIPEKGGYTIFTNIKKLIKPTKNDAIFWYNLMRNGDGDYRTIHGSCPVLVGEKWISTSWIHEWEQEFLRPCALSQLIEERYVGDLGCPEPKKYPNIFTYCK